MIGITGGKITGAASFDRSVGVKFYVFFPAGRRIIALAPPGIASNDAFESEPTASDWTVDGNGINKVLGAGWKKAAATEWATKKV